MDTSSKRIIQKLCSGGCNRKGNCLPDQVFICKRCNIPKPIDFGSDEPETHTLVQPLKLKPLKALLNPKLERPKLERERVWGRVYQFVKSCKNLDACDWDGSDSFFTVRPLKFQIDNNIYISINSYNDCSLLFDFKKLPMSCSDLCMFLTALNNNQKAVLEGLFRSRYNISQRSASHYVKPKTEQ